MRLFQRLLRTSSNIIRFAHASVNPSPTSSALRFQQKKKLMRKSFQPVKDRWSVVGYSTANEYNLLSLAENLEKQNLYEIQPLVEELLPTCIYVKSKYKVEEEKGQNGKDIFFFENGSVIFWNVPELERDNVIHFVKSVETEGFSEDTIYEESEMMNYKVKEELKSSCLQNGTIMLSQTNENSLKISLEKYAFSNGIAASVKLGTLEASLDRIIDSIEHISEDMKKGSSVKLSRQEVLRKTGELFALRHVLNLSLDLLDTPDFYWDREDLESLYHNICAHLTISKRTKVMNEKLSHCYELMSLITTHLNDEHHVRLEWFIIVLIMIEVVFELWHFIERYI